MSVYLDYAIAAGQSIVAFLLWHRAEPRMRIARGPMWGYCVITLGFALAASVSLTITRTMDPDPYNWLRTARDFIILLHAACIYRHAMNVLPKLA